MGKKRRIQSKDPFLLQDIKTTPRHTNRWLRLCCPLKYGLSQKIWGRGFRPGWNPTQGPKAERFWPQCHKAAEGPGRASGSWQPHPRPQAAELAPPSPGRRSGLRASGTQETRPGVRVACEKDAELAEGSPPTPAPARGSSWARGGGGGAGLSPKGGPRGPRRARALPAAKRS